MDVLIENCDSKPKFHMIYQFSGGNGKSLIIHYIFKTLAKPSHDKSSDMGSITHPIDRYY